tara:strand:+ start:1435 stop:1692 length:258 start_codon:yes stop_codon:yes gene_type:complete
MDRNYRPDPRNLTSNRDYGDEFSIAEFIDCVAEGAFIDYDGFGYFGFKSGEILLVDESRSIYPTAIHSKYDQIPQWVTHVLWFNR